MISTLLDDCRQFLDLLLAFRAQMRDWGGLGHGDTLWRLLHYLTDVKTWLMCLAPVLLLQRWWPARASSRAARDSFAFDWCYPVFSIGLVAWLIVPLVQGIHDLGKLHFHSEFADHVAASPPVVQFALAFLLQDFLRFFSHFLRHKLRWLWHFHAIHHSQVNMNPWTTHRAHPFEALVSATVLTLPIGVVGVDPVPWIYAGVTSMFWDLFLHSNVRTNLGLLGLAFASPQHHRIHHSSLPEHYDCNYGERLLLWDRIFGTLCRDRSIYPPTGCAETFHLMERQQGLFWIPSSWLRHLVFPIVQIGSSVRKYLNIWQ